VSELKPNYLKLNVSRELADISGSFVTSDVCHNYGIMGGCDEGCPALLDGDCGQPNDAIEHCDVDEFEREQILSMYN
jgi:hypothetical protein